MRLKQEADQSFPCIWEHSDFFSGNTGGLSSLQAPRELLSGWGGGLAKAWLPSSHQARGDWEVRRAGSWPHPRHPGLFNDLSPPIRVYKTVTPPWVGILPHAQSQPWPFPFPCVSSKTKASSFFPFSSFFKFGQFLI